jgi:hypothetical protein
VIKSNVSNNHAQGCVLPRLGHNREPLFDHFGKLKKSCASGMTGPCNRASTVAIKDIPYSIDRDERANPKSLTGRKAGTSDTAFHRLFQAKKLPHRSPTSRSYIALSYCIM